MTEPTDAMKSPFQAIFGEPIGYASYLGVPLSTDLTALRDDNAVIAFSRAMMNKMMGSRAKGRGGWQTCPTDELWQMLRDHAEKGDPVDVANIAMMIYHNDRKVTPSGAVASQVDEPCEGCGTPIPHLCSECRVSGQ
jgi:hypothetical protein